MKKTFFLLLIISLSLQSMAQESKFHKFRSLNFPVKWWAITHIFVVNKAFKISTKAQYTADESDAASGLDGQFSGGQTDAFRHGYWMAMLAREIGERRARSLGKAYERNNKADYRKGRLEDKYLPDFISSKMDLYNNEVGIKIGLANKNLPDDELIKLVKKNVIEGKMQIVKRNEKGEFLSNSGKVIPKEEYFSKWYTPKTLVKSNWKENK